MIADSYPMGVLSQIFNNLLSIAKWRLAIDHPVLFQDIIEQ
jgi:hypothetical protein